MTHLSDSAIANLDALNIVEAYLDHDEQKISDITELYTNSARQTDLIESLGLLAAMFAAHGFSYTEKLGSAHALVARARQFVLHLEDELGGD
jgi:hypothetical protein